MTCKVTGVMAPLQLLIQAVCATLDPTVDPAPGATRTTYHHGHSHRCPYHATTRHRPPCRRPPPARWRRLQRAWAPMTTLTGRSLRQRTPRQIFRRCCDGRFMTWYHHNTYCVVPAFVAPLRALPFSSLSRGVGTHPRWREFALAWDNKPRCGGRPPPHARRRPSSEVLQNKKLVVQWAISRSQTRKESDARTTLENGFNVSERTFNRPEGVNGSYFYQILRRNVN